MTILQKIEELILALSDPIEQKLYRNLWETLQKVIDDSNSHISRVISQMPEYDKHDKSHCDKVLENIEQLLGSEGISHLSLYELILIYGAAYLHDSSMALPDWEYQLLEMTEGTKEVNSGKFENALWNDFKPPHKIYEIIEFIEVNQNVLFDYSKARDFVFSPSSEDELVKELAERIQLYEEFRNGHVKELEDKISSKSSFLKHSKYLRSEFIRATHHLKVEKFIKNTLQKFESLGAANAEIFVMDLALICRSHGEDFSYIQKLNLRSSLHNDYANLPFLSILLRLGDILHFSEDRAPKSLFSETFVSEASIYHWTSKFNDLKYEIKNSNGMKTICYSAYCNDPKLYYFILDHITQVDNELNIYFSLYRFMEAKDYKECQKYRLFLNPLVERQIKYNSSVFTPQEDFKFRLDQKKVIEMLMGDQLYKNKFHCLRELYQNSLDACKCMAAHMKSTENVGWSANIEVGMGFKDEQKYIYCFDNGIGMNKLIIENYLLNIGNSYYKSNDFLKNNLNWDSQVIPTSQFGIGILSCFMLADRIEITTRHYNESNSISFSLSGVNERFYYINPDILDKEKIGTHGTIVKLFLKEEFQSVINNDYFQNEQSLIDYAHRGKDSKFDGLKNSLFYLLNSQVGLPLYEVDVVDNSNIKRPLIPCSEAFTIDYLANQEYEDYLFFGKALPFSHLYDWIYDFGDSFEILSFHVKSDNIEIHSHLCFPKNNVILLDLIKKTGCTDLSDYMNTYISDYLNFPKYVWPLMGVYVDGILIDMLNRFNYDSIYMHFFANIFKEDFRINFIGKVRPNFSIDRNSILSIPSVLEGEFKDIFHLFVQKLIDTSLNFILNNNIPFNSISSFIIGDILARKIGFFPFVFINIVKDTNFKKICLLDLKMDNNDIESILKSKKIKLSNLDLRFICKLTYDTLLLKMLNSKIKVNDFNLMIKSAESDLLKLDLESFEVPVLKADEWAGKYEEYDLVTHFWPIVPDRLFKKLKNQRKEETNETKIKIIHDGDIDKLKDITSLSIAPDFRHFDFVFFIDEFFESLDLSLDWYNQQRRYALYVFISPTPLSDDELFEVESTGNSDYIKGVKEGWSILFFNVIERYFILPGLIKKSDMLKKVPKKIYPTLPIYDLNDNEIIFKKK